jgi:hypothetical protein
MLMATPDRTPDEFRTPDLGISAFLVTKDFPLLRVDHEGERAFFVFPGPAERTAALYHLPGSNLIDASRFHYSLRELRGLARGGRQ